MELRVSEVIAFLALGLGIYTAYETWLKPFHPVFTLGEMIIHSVPGVDNPQGPPINKSFILPMTITNRGAISGVIEDLVLTIQKTGDPDPKWLYDALIEGDETVYYRQVWSGEVPAAFLRYRFRPFMLKGKEVIQKFFLFGVIEDNKAFPGRAWQFEPGSYRFRLLARVSGNKSFSEEWSKTFTFNEKVLKEIRISLSEHSEELRSLTSKSAIVTTLSRPIGEMIWYTLVLVSSLGVVGWALKRLLGH